VCHSCLKTLASFRRTHGTNYSPEEKHEHGAYSTPQDTSH